MEPFDGLDFVRPIPTGKDSPYPYIPIIMSTGHTEAWPVKQARDGGVNDFMAKPLLAKGLYQRVIWVIDNPRQFIRTKSFFGPDRWRETAVA